MYDILLLLLYIFLLMLLPPSRSTIFPYTTLFRSDKSKGKARHARVWWALNFAKVQAFLLEEVGNLVKFRPRVDRKSTRLNSSHVAISYAVFCLKKKIRETPRARMRTEARIIRNNE